MRTELMLKAFYLRISHETFEPLAVGALIGIAFVLYRHWRKSRAETLFFAGVVLYLVGWRVAMPILFERYALFLVPFATFFTAIAIRDIAAFAIRHWPRIPWNILCFGAMFIAIVVVAMRSSREDRAFFPLLERLRQEVAAGGGETVEVVSNRDFTVFLDHRARMFLVRDWEDYVRNARKRHVPASGGVRYVLLRLEQKHLPSADQLKYLKLIAVEKTFGRKKFSYFLWREIPDPHRKLILLPDAAAVEQHAAPVVGNLLGNAGFEQCRPAAEIRKLAAHYVKLGADFYRKPDWKLPVGWNPVMLRTRPNVSAPEFELSAAEPIRGKYSLRMKIDPRMSREISFRKRIPVGDYVSSVIVRAKKGARFRLYMHAYRKGKYAGDCNIGFCSIPADGTWFVSFPVRRADFRRGSSYDFAIGGLAGEMFFDEVSLCPVPAGETK